MQHETKMENQSWLKNSHAAGAGHVVNLCFIVVLLFPPCSRREVVVLEDAYISSQRNHLENVANALDKHLQYNVDKLIFCVMACAKLSWRHWISPLCVMP